MISLEPLAIFSERVDISGDHNTEIVILHYSHNDHSGNTSFFDLSKIDRRVKLTWALRDILKARELLRD